MPKFRYFQEGDQVNSYKIHRVLSENATPWLIRLIAEVFEEGDGSFDTEPVEDKDIVIPEGKSADEVRVDAEEAGNVFKYKEVTFDDWWGQAVADDTKDAWKQGVQEGILNDPEFGTLDAKTGEPI